MRIAVIGAGPAGLTSARQAVASGHEVVVYEATQDVGGIWNPASGGGYASVRMQSSRLSFPFSEHPPDLATDFATLAEVHGYLRSYAVSSAVLPLIRFGHRVTDVVRCGDQWRVSAEGLPAESVDAVMVASGELWEPRMPERLPPPGSGVQILHPKSYQRPQQLAGARVLVVGGGVSGADIASELAGVAASVDWSVRRRALFLPRTTGDCFNDELYSYVGRLAVDELPYPAYLALLASLMPDYFADYLASGLLPEDGFPHAVHVNDDIVARVRAGAVRVRPAFERFEDDGSVALVDGSTQRYDAVVLCLGYGMPSYDFLPFLDRRDLYEHHFYRHDPTLTVINTPVDTEAFGTACPYFEAIAGWAVAVLSGKVALPDGEAMGRWCAEHLRELDRRRHLDCWLETIRIGLLAGRLPDPRTAFDEYWRLVSSVVAPEYLARPPEASRPGRCDDRFDLAEMRLRILASLPSADRLGLVQCGRISPADLAAAEQIPVDRQIQPWLPYRQR
jgi:dimethylaniline monooxygenase (N-oxide forming)